MKRPGLTGLALMGLALALVPAIARADTYVVAPLDCADGEASANVTSLISGELDFQPGVDSVKEIRTEPSGSSCLGSTSCLGALLREGGGQKLITGTLTTSSTVYKLDLVLFDGSRVVNRKQFELPATPTDVADGMTAVVKDMLKGGSAAPAAATAAYAFSGDGDEDFDIDEGPTAAERAAAEAAEAKRVAAAEESRRVEEQRRLDEERARREEEERLAAAEAARRAAVERDEAIRRAEAERRAAVAAVAANDDFDPSSISFATSTRDIKVESAEDIEFASIADVEEAVIDRDYDEEYLDEDLDDDHPAQHRSEPQPSRSSSSRPKPAKEARHAVGITARGGYSSYYQLGFITYGGELSIPLAQTGLYAIGGMEAYSTNRTLPAELQTQLGRTHAWDTIFPFNVGLLYKFDRGGKLVPFVGADAIFGQYYVEPETNASAWTVGARARLGLDIYFTRIFGLDINASAGFWHGGSWEIIDQGMKNTGFLPQISAGAAFRF